MSKNKQPKVVVIISADQEWRVLLDLLPEVELQASPLGQWFSLDMEIHDQPEAVWFFHGGWGKIAAAASAQYVIDRWQPALLLNMATCGGFAGHVEKDTIILAERTIVYDIIEQMVDPTEAIAHFSTDIDLSWLTLPYPQMVRRTLLVSGDRDLIAEELPALPTRYGAIAGVWESGASAWVAARNNVRCIILRGVTDLVGADGGEAYEGNLHVFVSGTRRVFEKILPHLQAWIECALPPQIKTSGGQTEPRHHQE
jgi:adenosylhomocysteine nucleosidase